MNKLALSKLIVNTSDNLDKVGYREAASLLDSILVKVADMRFEDSDYDPSDYGAPEMPGAKDTDYNPRDYEETNIQSTEWKEGDKVLDRSGNPVGEIADIYTGIETAKTSKGDFVEVPFTNIEVKWFKDIKEYDAVAYVETKVNGIGDVKDSKYKNSKGNMVYRFYGEELIADVKSGEYK